MESARTITPATLVREAFRSDQAITVPWFGAPCALRTRHGSVDRLSAPDVTRAGGFAGAYRPGDCGDRVEAERWNSFPYDELVARDTADLDLAWVKDESLEDMDNLPLPDVIAREIVEDLTAALAEFEAVATALEAQFGRSAGALRAATRTNPTTRRW